MAQVLDKTLGGKRGIDVLHDSQINKSSAFTDRAERANKWVVLALAGTSAFMTTLDASIVNIGLPSIARTDLFNPPSCASANITCVSLQGPLKTSHASASPTPLTTASPGLLRAH